jgi:hypothetical protein
VGRVSRLRTYIVLLVALAVTALAPANSSADHNLGERVSTGYPASEIQAHFVTASDDGQRVFFETLGTIECHERGNAGFFYERSFGTTKLVSVDPGGQPHCATNFLGMSADGSHVFFDTYDRVTPEDVDNGIDIYERYAGQTRLVTTGPTDPHSTNLPLAFKVSEDGTRAFFETYDTLVAQDDDGSSDVYERSGGTTTLRSVRSDGANTAGSNVVLTGISADGSKLFVTTGAVLVPDDPSPAYPDLYEYEGSTVRLLSDWAHGGALQTVGPLAVADDGSAVIVKTGTPLDPADVDGEIDLYELRDGQRILLSGGTTGGSEGARALFTTATPDTSSVWFYTTDALSPDDNDLTTDLYRRSGGTTTLISTGPTAGSGSWELRPFYVAAATNGAITYFTTKEPLVPEDVNADFDVYARSGGTTTLAVPGSSVVPSEDGSRLFYGCDGGDADGGQADVCERHAGQTTVISATPSPAPYISTLGGITPDGLTAWFNTSDGIGDDTIGPDVYVARVSPLTGYPRPRGATPFLAYLVPFYSQCAAPNSSNSAHGAPLAFPSCTPPKPLHTQVTIGTPDSNGLPAKSIGWVLASAKVGDPATPANEADLRLRVHESDIRNTSDLSDYGGQLEAALTVRATDHDGTNAFGNGPASATSADFPVHFAVGCTATADTTVGSSCDVDTSANALAPGAVVESRRTIWELGQVKVLDGGLDGLASTEDDNLLFQVQGLFVP